MKRRSVSLLGTMRDVIRQSERLGSVSCTYHLAAAVRTERMERPRRLFSNAWADRRAPPTIAIRRHIEMMHDVVIEQGHPTNYRSIMHSARALNAKVAREIDARVAVEGITDELIIPVYGPFNTEGCFCFGFDRVLEAIDKEVVTALEGLAGVSHSRFVVGFRDRVVALRLTPEQRDILAMYAQGYRAPELAERLSLELWHVEVQLSAIRRMIGFPGRLSFVLASLCLGLSRVNADQTLAPAKSLPG